MSVSDEAPSQDRSGHPLTGLLVAAHLGPALAGHGDGHRVRRRARPERRPRVALVGAAVLAGQLIDRLEQRPRSTCAATARSAATDKPLATGAVSVRDGADGVRGRGRRRGRALAGLRARGRRGAPRPRRRRVGLQPRPQGHRRCRGCPTPSPSAGCRSSCTSPATSTCRPPRCRPPRALLGVGAHLLNALPDLADDRGHRCRRAAAPARRARGRRGSRWPPSPPPRRDRWPATGDVAPGYRAAVLAVGAAAGGARASPPRGRRPFQAAVAIALVDVLLLVVARDRHDEHWDVVVVGAGPAGSVRRPRRAARATRRPGAAARPRRLPPRQVLRRRHRPARARRARARSARPTSSTAGRRCAGSSSRAAAARSPAGWRGRST